MIRAGIDEPAVVIRWNDLHELAAPQYGVLSSAQTRLLGLPSSTLNDRVAEGACRRIHRNVVALPGVPSSYEQDISAALLAVGGDVLAARWTAAWLHGLIATPPSDVWLIVPAHRAAPKLRRVRTTRSVTLCPDDATRVRRLAATTVPRTIGDLAAVTAGPFLRGVVIDARQRRQAQLAEIEAVAARIGNAPGIARLRRILWELDETRCDSVLEHRVRRELRKTDLPPPHREPLEIELSGQTLHLDIPWPKLRVGIETDGFGSHSERLHLDRDHRRHNRIVLGGWRVLRVGWWRVEHDLDGFFGEVRAILGER